MEFTDALGRVWRPKVTARVIRDFEEKTGRGLLEGVADAILKNDVGDFTEADGNKKMAEAMLKIGTDIFGHVGNISYLLFESCNPETIGEERGVFYTDAEKGKQEVVSYNDFCEAITKTEIALAMTTAINILLDFFPQAKAEGGDRKRADSKKAVGLGKTSSSTQGSPE